MSDSPSAGFSPLPYAVVLLAAIGGCAFLGKAYLDRELARRPPIVFVDELRIVRESQPRPGTPREQAEAILRETRAAADALAAEGYIVLDRRAVYAAPASFEVEP